MKIIWEIVESNPFYKTKIRFKKIIESKAVNIVTKG